MRAPESESTVISLEWYLSQADSKPLKDHRHLSSLIAHLDPFQMLNFSLYDRMMPLDESDIRDLRNIAFIKTSGPPETLHFTDKYCLLQDPLWWQVLGDPVESVQIFKLNLQLTTTDPLGWKIVLIKQSPDRQPGNDMPYSLGWIHEDELEHLRILTTKTGCI